MITKANKEMYREEYLAFLKEQLKERCNDNMCCEINWDYRDELQPSALKEAVEHYKKYGYEVPKDYLKMKLLEMNVDYDNYMFDEIKSEIENCENEHVAEYFYVYGNLYEDAQAVGYNCVDVNIDEILGKSKFCVNIMFATDCERNYDMRSIVSAFGSWRAPDFDYLSGNIDDLDNALTYFIHQQGHSVKEIYDCLIDNPKGFENVEKMSFAKAVVNDIVNSPSDVMSELTALVKLDGNQFFEFLEAVEKGEKYLILGKETMMGIFNEWAGSGGLLEFSLDKPFVVPSSMIREVQIEGANNFNYSVNNVYGLVGSCWKEALGYTDEKPILYEENLAATVKAVKEYEKERKNKDKLGLAEQMKRAEAKAANQNFVFSAPNKEDIGLDL